MSFCTPICTTLDVQSAYEPLAKYEVNIFAFDFSGTGKSGGAEKDFSIYIILNDQDNSFYEMLLERNPDIFKSSTKIMNAMFECLVSKDSPIQNNITIPTLV